MAIFRRKLAGHPDSLWKYRLKQIALKDDYGVIRNYPAAVYTGDPGDQVSGMLFELYDAELQEADFYETEAYARKLVWLASGKQAWVYISAG